jgi:hypothetical protein
MNLHGQDLHDTICVNLSVKQRAYPDLKTGLLLFFPLPQLFFLLIFPLHSTLHTVAAARHSPPPVTTADLGSDTPPANDSTLDMVLNATLGPAPPRCPASKRRNEEE